MQKNLLEILAENVKYYRSKTGLSQLNFAMRINISPFYLNDIESGRQYASLKMLERLAKEFRIEPYQLLLPKDIIPEQSVLTEYENELRTLKEQIDNLFDNRLTK
jgi:transcriptional regulator with XRE-family HTH domain